MSPFKGEMPAASADTPAGASTLYLMTEFIIGSQPIRWFSIITPFSGRMAPVSFAREENALSFWSTRRGQSLTCSPGSSSREKPGTRPFLSPSPEDSPGISDDLQDEIFRFIEY